MKLQILFDNTILDGKKYSANEVVEIDENIESSLKKAFYEEWRIRGQRIVISYEEMSLGKIPIVYYGMSLYVNVTNYGQFKRGIPQYFNKDKAKKLVSQNPNFKFSVIYVMYVGDKEKEYIQFLDKKNIKFLRFTPISISLDYLDEIRKRKDFVVSTLKDIHKKYIYNLLKNLSEKKEEFKVCIIRGGARGDVLMCLPIARALKEEFSNCYIIFKTSDYCKDLLIGNPHIDEIVEGVLTPIKSDFVVQCDDIVTVYQRDSEKHFIDVALEKVGLKPINRSVDYYIKFDEKQKAKKYIKSLKLNKSKKTIGIIKGGNVTERTWDKDKLKILIKRLKLKYNIINLDSRGLKGKYNWMGTNFKKSFRDNVALVEHCDLVLSPDTSFIHIAGALKKKFVGLFSYVSSNARIAFDSDCISLRGKYTGVNMTGSYTGYVEYDIKQIKINDVYNAIERKLLSNQKKVSIIIPVWNGLDWTTKCLKSIKEKTKNIDYEIVIVDNGSEIPILEHSDYLLIRNYKNMGYGFANNQGARYAVGEYLLFLNNDIEIITEDWLENMLKVFKENKEIGIVGAKLLYPNGKIQHAGVRLMGNKREDISSIHMGGGRDRYDEMVCNSRVVEGVTGACMLINRNLFFKALCFDTQYSPAYCEDADLCHKVNKLGYKNYYCAKAELTHYVAKTSCNLSFEDIEKIKNNNKALLKKRWNLL